MERLRSSTHANRHDIDGHLVSIPWRCQFLGGVLGLRQTFGGVGGLTVLVSLRCQSIDGRGRS